MGKRAWTPKQNKRSIVVSLLDGKYTIEVAARVRRVHPATIKQWLYTFGGEVPGAKGGDTEYFI